jgi:nucleoside-diphosphate-sugar epimerase
MIIAITGGSGFIGKGLIRHHLLAGDEVRFLTRKSGEVFRESEHLKIHRTDLLGNLKDLARFAEGADILYHCAGEIRDAKNMHSIHVQGTRNLLKVASKKTGHWIQLSSVGVYGPLIDGIVTEETPLNPRGIYETTKTESDRLVLEAASKGEINLTILRPSNVYGPNMTQCYLFNLIKMIDKGLFFFIGPPGASANYIHVDNVVQALILCSRMEKTKSYIYNLSDYCSMESFISIITQKLDIPIPSIRLPKALVQVISYITGFFPGSPLTPSRVHALSTRSQYSTNKIQNELNYSHSVSMTEGIEQMINYYLTNLKNKRLAFKY